MGKGGLIGIGKVIRTSFIKGRSPPHRVGDGEGGGG